MLGHYSELILRFVSSLCLCQLNPLCSCLASSLLFVLNRVKHITIILYVHITTYIKSKIFVNNSITSHNVSIVIISTHPLTRKENKQTKSQISSEHKPLSESSLRSLILLISFSLSFVSVFLRLGSLSLRPSSPFSSVSFAWLSWLLREAELSLDKALEF